MTTREELISKILTLELEMFLSVQTDGSNVCQENPEAFKVHRAAQFSAWSEDTLNSYHSDIEAAKSAGKNLMTIKYARMANMIPPVNDSPFIDELVNISINWQTEMAEKYPNLMAKARGITTGNNTGGGTSFECYLRSELETYSEQTLGLLAKDYVSLLDQNRNGSEEVYQTLVKKLGYKSVPQAENSIHPSNFEHQ